MFTRQKLTGQLVVLSLLLFVCICIPEFSNAQKLKPKAVGINKPGISKSVVKKPGLSSSIKSKLPALEVSRLALDSGCKITGFLQNKGSKMGISHPDLPKLSILIGYTFNGKTVDALLETRPGGGAVQPPLLISFSDMVNFTNGRPAKFTSKLQVPATGNSFATVFAEIDPNNRIRETREGEQRKRIQKRLRSKCAPRLSPVVTVKVPTKKEKVKAIYTAKVIKPPAGVSTPQTTGRIFEDSGIKVTNPNSDIVRNNVTIKYQFLGSSSPPDKISIALKGFCEKKAYNGRYEQFGIAHIYDGPPLESHRVNLSSIDFSSVGIEDICQGDVKYFFEVGEVREVGETSAGRVWGYSKRFTYLPYAIARPGSKSVKASKIKIDPNTKKRVNIPVPTSFDADKMVAKGDGDHRFVVSPIAGQQLVIGQPIPIEVNCPLSVNPINCDIDYCTISILAHDASYINEERYNFPQTIEFAEGHFKDTPSGSSPSVQGGRLAFPWNFIPQNIKDFFYYQIEVKGYKNGREAPIAIGQSGEFIINRVAADSGRGGTHYDPSPVSNGLEVTSPDEDDIIEINHEERIYFNRDEEISVQTGDQLFVSLSPVGNSAIKLLREPHSLVSGSLSSRTFMCSVRKFIPGDFTPGRYRFNVEIIRDGSEVVASGSSAIFRLTAPSISGDGGTYIMSPSSRDHYRPGPDNNTIIMQYIYSNAPYGCSILADDDAVIYLESIGTGDTHSSERFVLHSDGLPESTGMETSSPTPATLRLTIPTEVFRYIDRVDPTGEAVLWRVHIDAPGIMMSCDAYSETFRISH